MANHHEQRTRISDPSVLSRYLPDSVVQHLLEPSTTQPSDIDLGLHVTRLRELLQHIVTYVPEYANVSRHALPSIQTGALSSACGTLLAADLSGFTAFSARLSTLGSEGAELVARTISTLFGSLIETLSAWEGSLLKLSGDALTGLFSGEGHAQRAAAAALELQRRMGAFKSLATPAGDFTLRMRIGLASGEVLLAQLGAPERVELLVAGATARRVMELQRRAEPGAVVMGAATYAEVAPHARVVTLASGLYRVLAIEPLDPPTLAEPAAWLPRRDPIWELHSLVARIEALRPYLVDQHVSRMAGGLPMLAGDGDLRPVTVLFAALSDTGPLIEHAQPEAQARALARIQDRARQLWEIVARHGGTVNKLDLHPDGHTLIALFGAPIAQGRDAERAVSCAQELLHSAAPGSEATPLLVRRIGLATGRVFAGAVGSADRREYTVMGSVVNLAARLMDIAADDQALIDVATARVVGRSFHLQEQPPMLVKGYDQPVPFYAIGVEQRSRLSSLMRANEPLIGRANELAAARAAVARALAGRGGVVALVGEAGIGKSRLLAEIARTALVGRAPGVLLAVAQAQPHSRVQPYGIIAEVFRQIYQLPERVEDAVPAFVERARGVAREHERFLPLLPTIFGLPGEENALTQALAPDERRDRLHALAAALLVAQAGDMPTALVIEDLHWVDLPSIEILGAVAVGAARSALRLLLLCTYRPEGAPAWPAAAAARSIELAPLTPEQSQELVTAWLGPRALSERLRAAVIERTQGNPFFIEETARALRDRGLVLDSEPPLPPTIQSALLARLDRLLAEDRYVLQVAAVIGPLFRRSLLATVAGDRVALGRSLERLAAHGLVRAAGEGRYTFSHSLTQETVYESLLFAQRRQLHRAIGDSLRDRPNQPDADPGILAYHYRRAEAWPEALEFAWQAGLRAQSLYAGDVALDHFQQALEAANRLDGGPADRRPAILRRIGDLHALAGRYADAVAAYSAALAVSDDQPGRAEVLICWAEAREQQAAYDEALALLQRAQRQLGAEDEALALRIAVRRGWVLILRGDAEQAQAAVEPYLERLEVQQRWQDLLLAYKVFFHIALNQSRWSEARSYLRLALSSAERTGDMREIARIYNNMGVVLSQEGDLPGATQALERCAQIVAEIGDRYGLALTEGNIGATYYKLGDFMLALSHYRTCLELATAIGNQSIEGTVRSNLGEVYRRIGQLDESLDQLQRSVALCHEIQDDLGLAEAQRQLAETYIAMDRLVEAEAACARAIEWAKRAVDAQTEAIACRVCGVLAAKRGDGVTAIESVQRSIQILTELGSTQELAQSLAVAASIWLTLGRADLARAAIEEAIELFQKAGASADLEHARRQLDTASAELLIEKVSS